MAERRCPTHPRFALDNCPECERRIEEDEHPWDPPGAWRAGQDRYERWLDEIGGGG